MTLEEFEAQRDLLACRLCGHVGLVALTNPNNGDLRPGCANCGYSSSVREVQWLMQTSADRWMLRPPSGDSSASEVWEANGNSCAFCGKTRTACEQFGIGITIQHVIPVSQGGEAGPLVPFCTRCQQVRVAALAETQRLRHYTERLEDTIASLRDKQRALGRERGLQ